jgi:hypothetical protein
VSLDINHLVATKVSEEDIAVQRVRFSVFGATGGT